MGPPQAPASARSNETQDPPSSKSSAGGPTKRLEEQSNSSSSELSCTNPPQGISSVRTPRPIVQDELPDVLSSLPSPYAQPPQSRPSPSASSLKPAAYKEGQESSSTTSSTSRRETNPQPSATSSVFGPIDPLRRIPACGSSLSRPDGPGESLGAPSHALPTVTSVRQPEEVPKFGSAWKADVRREQQQRKEQVDQMDEMAKLDRKIEERRWDMQELEREKESEWNEAFAAFH